DRTRVPRDRDALRAVVRQELEQHVREAEQRVRREALRRRELLRQREECPVGEVVSVDEEELSVSRRTVVELELGACERLRHSGPGYRPAPMPRVPLLAGSRLVVVTTEDDALALRPPPPAGGIADVRAAVRDALRFPLAGEPLEALVPRSGGRATIVVEPPALPLPGTERDPRQEAIAAAVEELERLGIQSGYQTLLVAGGLARRAGHELLTSLVSPEFARRFHGHVEVHDLERDDLVDVGRTGSIPLCLHPALVETDVVVIVTAAESVLHGGPAALVGCSGRE